jgi:hypothetical protein
VGGVSLWSKEAGRQTASQLEERGRRKRLSGGCFAKQSQTQPVMHSYQSLCWDLPQQEAALLHAQFAGRRLVCLHACKHR